MASTELLRSYRIAHGRATSIEPFERALRENTPLTTIKDPDAFLEYLKQVNMKADMIMEELKRVSAEKDSFKKKLEDTEAELATTKDELSKLKETRETQAAVEPTPGDEEPKDDKEDEGGAAHSRSPEAAKSPIMSSVLGLFSPKEKPAEGPSPDAADEKEDLFSFEAENSQFEAQLAAKSDEIEKLRTEVESLKTELSVNATARSAEPEQLRAQVGTLESELSAAKQAKEELSEQLNKATAEVGDASKKAAAAQAALQAQIDSRTSEIAGLKEKLDQAQAQLKDLEEKKAKQKSVTTTAIKDQQAKLSTAKDEIEHLKKQVKLLTEEKAALIKHDAIRAGEVHRLRAEAIGCGDELAKLADVKEVLVSSFQANPSQAHTPRSPHSRKHQEFSRPC